MNAMIAVCRACAAFAMSLMLSGLNAGAQTVKEKLESKYDYVSESRESKTGTLYYVFENFGNDLKGAADSKGRVIFDMLYADINLCGLTGPDYLWWDVEDENGKHAFFDYSGRQILPFAFDDIDLERGSGDKKMTYIEVTEDGKVGAFDLKGKRRLPSEFDYISYEDGLGDENSKYYWEVTNDDQKGAYSVDGKMLLPCKFAYLMLEFDEDYGKWFFNVKTKDNLCGLYDFNGKVLAEPVYSKYPYFSNDGKSTVVITDKSGKLGALDLNGKVLADNKYAEASDVWKAINPKSAAASAKQEAKSPVHQALIDKYPGATISYPDKYGNYAYSKCEGEKCYEGLFNADGQPILDPANRYNSIRTIELPGGEALLVASTYEPNSMRLYDLRGNILTPQGYQHILLKDNNPGGISYFEVSRKTPITYEPGILGLDGQVIVPCGEACEITLVQNPKTPKYIFRTKTFEKNNPRFGAYGLKGEFLADAIYPDIESLYASPLDGAGLLDYLKRHYQSATLIDGATAKHKAYCVGNDNKYGIIDQYGRVIAPCEYQSVSMIADNKSNSKHIAYVVRKNGRDGVFDANGRQILPCKYVMVNADASGGFLVVSEKGWGFANSRGVEVVPAVYDVAAYVPAIETGPDYIVAINDNGTGAFTPSGSLIVPCRYDEVRNLEGSSFGGYKFMVRKGTDYGLYDWSGRVIVPCQYADISLCQSPAVSGYFYVGETSSGAKQAYDDSGTAIAMPVAQQQQQSGPDWQKMQQTFAQLSQDMFALAQRMGRASGARNTGNPAGAPQTMSPAVNNTASASSWSTPSSSTSGRMTTGADVQNRANQQRAYDNWASQLSSMNYGVYPYSNGYTMSDVRKAQSEMRSIRTEWNSKHPDIPIYEDRRAENWNGIKGSM